MCHEVVMVDGFEDDAVHKRKIEKISSRIS